MVDTEYKIGQTVLTNEGRQGIIRYIGELHIASGNWLGLELPDASGKNDGSVKGERYFTCKPGYGIFVRDGAIVEISKQPEVATTSKSGVGSNGSATASKPRPSSGLSADVARRRQSLMSNGSGSVGGSRLSTRSPTKSPIKPTSTSASSATSTPRTTTPSTLNRPSIAGTKSRLSTTARPSLGPTATGTRTSKHTSRPSITNPTVARNTTTSRSAPIANKTHNGLAKPLASRTSISHQEKPSTKVADVSAQKPPDQQISSPTINEEDGELEDEKENTNRDSAEEMRYQSLQSKDVAQSKDDANETAPVHNSTTTRTVAANRPTVIGNAESRAAQQRETEQLKAKIRALEKKRQDDRDKIKQVETLQGEKDRFEGIIQALQKKMRANQQELVDMRKRCEEAETKANSVPEYSGELESEIELATLDKEMAEERAETVQIELEALKTKHEELELEVEILREENAELTSTMSPEEKANAGWLQMERERERLRDALIRLRDMSQENESSLRTEIDELREHLDEAEKTAGMYVGTKEKLTRIEETNKHLMGQLEAVESNDEVVEALEIQREQHMNSIAQLKTQIQDLEEHILVTDELELFHVEEEKRLHAQIDENEALLSESSRRHLEQDRVIEDLEYTLTKFRDVVQGLQSDIDELRRSREISEMQANEMSSKSRAMMDLNLRLQNNAAKTQAKMIDTELDKVAARLSNKHVEILSMFTPESFDQERKPILALLSFGRVKSKASLVGKILAERLRERSYLNSGEEIFKTFETMEYMEWISKTCHRFEMYMGTCGIKEFTACGVALAELDPVERTVTGWIEALRKDELSKNEPEHLKRMQGVLEDLAEKLIAQSVESKATELTMQIGTIENLAESIAGQLGAIVGLVQSKLGSPKSEDEESLVFDKKMNELATKSRTVRFLCGKAVQQSNDLCNSSLCLTEPNWPTFEEAKQAAESLSKQVRAVGLVIAEELSKLDVDEPLSYVSLPGIISSALRTTAQSNEITQDDPFAVLSVHLNSLQHFIDDIQNRTLDLDNTMEFEPQPAPWLVRAKEIKTTKYISSEVQEALARFERRNIELGNKVAEREKIIEEMGMRAELAEKRFKEIKEKDNNEKVQQDDLNRLKSEKQTHEQILADLRAELKSAQENAASTQIELEALKKAAGGEALAMATTATSTGSAGIAPSQLVDESIVKQYELEVNLIQAEITSLQAAVRYLREENRTLRIPVSEVLINSAKHNWLDGSIAKRPKTTNIEQARRTAKLQREGADVWTDLIHVAKTVKPIRLSTTAASTAPTADEIPTSWRSVSQTTRYAVLKQREELERWEAMRDDFIRKVKVETLGARMMRSRLQTGKTSLPKLDSVNSREGRAGTVTRKLDVDKLQPVQIVEF